MSQQRDEPKRRGLLGRIGGTFLGAPPIRAGVEGVALAVVLCLGIVLSSGGQFGVDTATVQVLVVGPLCAMLIAGRMRLGGGDWHASLVREGVLDIVLVAVVTVVGVLAAVGAGSGPRVGVVDILPAAFGFFLWNLGAFAFFRALAYLWPRWVRLRRSRLRWR